MKPQMRMIVSAFLGLAIGGLYFFLIHSLLGGIKGGYILLERGSAIVLIFQGMPIIMILTMVATAATFPGSYWETFRVAFVGAFISLLPIPVLQYFSNAPALYKRPRFSLFIMEGAAIGIIGLTIAALIIAGVSCLLSPWLDRLFRRLLGRV
jgi:hypothetical protein